MALASTMPELPSLASLISGDSAPTGAMQAAAQQPNVLDNQAKRWQGISDGFQQGQLTPLTAILKGVTGQVAQGKSEKAQAQRDAKQEELNKILTWKAQQEQHQAEVKQMLAAHQEASMTGNQLAQSIDQLATGDESGVRNWLASNPETAKMLSQKTGVPVESATFTKLNGVDTLIPYGRDAQGNPVTGEPIAVDTLLKGYAPEAYQARYSTRQADALAQANIQNKQLEGQKTQAEIDHLNAKPDGAAQPKPLPSPIAKMQNETLNNIGSIGQTNANLQEIIDNIDGGKLDVGVLSRGSAALRNSTNSSTPESRAVADYTANLKKMVNDSLLLAKGVQTEGDAKRAADAVLSAPYDTQAVRERLLKLQQINAHTMEILKAGNDEVRSNYGHEPMDYTPYEGKSSPPSASAGQYKEGQTATNPQTGQKITYRGGKWQ